MDCFIPCTSEERAPIRTWFMIDQAKQDSLQMGMTIMDFPTGFCDPDDGAPLTVDITAGPAPDAPDPTVQNSRPAGQSGTQSFRLGRATPGDNGVEYCFAFNQGTNFVLDNRAHRFFARSENIVVTASYYGTPVNLIAEYLNPNNVQTATVSGNGTDKVQLISTSGQRRRLIWQVASVDDEPITDICIQYFRTNPSEVAGAEPFRLSVCGDVCPDFQEQVAVCDDPQVISRWNALTAAERADLNDTDPDTNVSDFDTGFCNPDGTPFVMDIEVSGAQNSAAPTVINNVRPRRALNSSYLAARSNGGASGAENCFAFEEAVPFRVDSRDHKCFNRSEFIVVTAFEGETPVALEAEYIGNAGPATIAGNGTNEIVFAANGRTGCGLWWQVSSGDAQVTDVCVQYYRDGGAFRGAEPFRLSICNTDRCIFDDPFAIAERDLGDGDLLAQLPNAAVQDQVDVSKNIAGIAQAASGVPGNVDLTFRIIATNNGTQTLTNLELVDDIENAISAAALVGLVGTEIVEPATTASANPTLSATYDGIADVDVLTGTDGSLAVGQTLVVDITFEVDASALVPNAEFTNTAQITGTNPDGTLATGSSDVGIGEAGDTGGNQDPTPVLIPALNLTKSLIASSQIGGCASNGTVRAQFSITLENTGNVDLTNIQIQDDLAGQLPGAFIEIAVLQFAEIVASTATIDPVLNNGFNDSLPFDENLFDGTSGLLEPGQSITIEYMAIINPSNDFIPGPVSSQAAASANGVDPVGGTILVDPNTGLPYVAVDLSDDGLDPNSLNAGEPGDTGTQDDPTPVSSRLASVQLFKNVSNVSTNSTTGLISATYSLTAVNTGGVTLTEVQITDNVQQQLGAALVSVSGMLSNGGTTLLNGNGSLLPGQSVSASFTAVLDPAALPNPADIVNLTNQAVVSASAPGVTGGFITVSDISDSGSADGMVGGAPGDTGCGNDPTPLFGNGADGCFPVFTAIPADLTIETYGVGLTALNDFVDNDGGLVAFVSNAGQNFMIANDFDIDNFVEDCSPYSGTIDITFTYSDDCGNVFDFPVTVTLVDETPPTCVKPFDLVIDCNDEDFEETVAAFAAYWGPVTDLSHPITITSSFDPDGFDEDGSQTIMWTFTDACGNTTTLDAVLTVTGDCSDTLIITSVTDLTVDCAEGIPAADGSGITAETTCEGGIIDTELTSETVTNEICENSFTLVRTYLVSDACGNSETVTQNIVISDTTAPVFTFVPADFTVACPATPEFGTPTTADDCSAVTLTQNITGGGNCPDGYTTSVMWTATDACGNSSTAMQTITVTEQQDDPELTVTPPADFQAECTDDLPESNVTATTTCADGVINIDQSEEVTETICAGSFTLVRTFVVSDNCGNSETVTQTITVTDTTPPVFTDVPASADVMCDAYPDGFGPAPNASDACSDVTVTFEDELAPYICDADFNITRTWTAVDACGNSTSVSQTLTVWPDLEPPVFTFVPGDMTISCPDAVVFGEVEVTDACTEFTVTEEITATGACPEAYTTTKTWTAIDGCGNASTASQTITVQEQPTPITLEFTFVPVSQFVECGSEYAFGEPTCAGNCDGGFTLTYEDVTEAGICDNSETVTRYWTAVDNCGNAAVCEQTLTVTDQTAPVFTAFPGDKVIGCAEEPVFDTPAATDLCGGVTLTFADNTEWSDCDGVAYSLQRTWTATDDCGNASVQVQTLTVEEDSEAPVLSDLEDKVIDCGDAVVFDTPTAYDACGETVLTYTDETVYSACTVVNQRIWTATDGCLNAAVKTQTVTTIDDAAPTFNVESHTLELTAYEYLSWTAPEVIAYDECSTVSLNDMTTYTYPDGRIAHSWLAYDACGNKSSVTITLSPVEGQDPSGGILTAGFTVYPNPTGEMLNVNFIGTNDVQSLIEVHDVRGQVQLTQDAVTYKGSNSVRLDLSNLAPGAYFIRLQTGGETQVQRIMKF